MPYIVAATPNGGKIDSVLTVQIYLTKDGNFSPDVSLCKTFNTEQEAEEFMKNYGPMFYKIWYCS